MTNEIKKIITSTNKCLLISTINNDIIALPCQYCFDYINLDLIITFDSYNNILNHLINHPNLTLYINVCDEYQIYYLIIDGNACVSSTAFSNPTPKIHSSYQIKVKVNNTTCYTEKR